MKTKSQAAFAVFWLENYECIYLSLLLVSASVFFLFARLMSKVWNGSVCSVQTVLSKETGSDKTEGGGGEVHLLLKMCLFSVFDFLGKLC